MSQGTAVIAKSSRRTVFCPGCGGDWEVGPPAREPEVATAELPDVIECECGMTLELFAAS